MGMEKSELIFRYHHCFKIHLAIETAVCVYCSTCSLLKCVEPPFPFCNFLSHKIFTSSFSSTDSSTKKKVHRCNFPDYFCCFHGTSACPHANEVQERHKMAHSECADKKIFSSMLHVEPMKRSERKQSFPINPETDIRWKSRASLGGYKKSSGISSFLGWQWSGCRHFGDFGGLELGWQNGLLHRSRPWGKEAVTKNRRGLENYLRWIARPTHYLLHLDLVCQRIAVLDGMTWRERNGQEKESEDTETRGEDEEHRAVYTEKNEENRKGFAIDNEAPICHIQGSSVLVL